MLWLLPGADSSRVSIIIILTYLIGLGGFNHTIAGSVKMFYLVVTGGETFSAYLTQFLAPTLLGGQSSALAPSSRDIRLFLVRL